MMNTTPNIETPSNASVSKRTPNKFTSPTSPVTTESQTLLTSNDVEQGSTMIQSDFKGKPIHPLAVLRFLVLLITNIAAWYLTNGFNGIALQSYAKRIRESAGEMTLTSASSTMAVVTAMQLGLGACIGYTILLILSFFLNRKTPSLRSILTLNQDEIVAGSLHGIGSVCTNLGFMFGSASLVQILKLLEPFETLALSQLMIPEEGRITHGVVSSMLVLVGAAISLIRIRSDSPHPYSVLFAVLSGCTLSCRNVLQRRQHRASSVSDNNKSTNSCSSASASEPATETADSQLQKVERSLQQFTKLSLHSCFMSSILGVALHAASPAAVHLLNWKVLTWHPLYNIFSMITLGFCSALTHSLLNAGKRVFAILMAILWFGEDFSIATVFGLLTVAGGGAWYSTESKKRVQGGWGKVGMAILILATLLKVQTSSLE
jgi:drug/metabolite transporter (DMT)-like permease